MTHLIGHLEPTHDLVSQEVDDLQALFRTLHGPDAAFRQADLSRALRHSKLFVTTADPLPHSTRPRIVGMATLSLTETLDGLVGHVGNVAVLPDYRGQGRTFALLRELCLTARRDRAVWLLADCPIGHETAQALCMTVGLEQTSRRHFKMVL